MNDNRLCYFCFALLFTRGLGPVSIVPDKILNDFLTCKPILKINDTDKYTSVSKMLTDKLLIDNSRN